MVLRTSLGTIFLLLASLSAQAGDKKLDAHLAQLQARVTKRDFADDKLRRELLVFCRQHVGTPHYAKAIDLLRQTPSPFDKLDAKAIDEEDRKGVAIPALVGFVQSNDRAVASIAISLDGTMLATSGWDNAVHLFKLGGKEPKPLAKLEGSPSGIAFSPDGKYLATGCAQTNVILWDVSGDKPKLDQRLGGHKQRPFSVAFSPTGKMLASGCYDPVMRVWKTEDLTPEVWGILANEKTSSLGISSLAFSHDGKLLIAGSHIGKETLRIWDAAGNILEEKAPPGVKARILAASPAEPILAFAGDDAEIRLWNIAPRVEERRKLAGHTGKALPPLVKALAFSPDGKLLASCGQDKCVRLWDVASGEKRREWTFGPEPRALAFSSDGRHLAVGNSDGTVCVLRLAPVKSD